MDLSKVKLVVSDMDGTLLNSNHEVSDRFFSLFKELKKREIIFVAASGRQYNSIIDKLYPIKDDIIVVAENGGFVMYKDKEILATPLPKLHRNQTLEVLKEVPDIYSVLCGKHAAFLAGQPNKFTRLLEQYYSGITLVDDLTAVEDVIIKIATFHYESSEQFIYPYVKHLEGELKVKISGANWVDISSPNANKGFALQHLQKHFSIGCDETMVFGDYNNDLEMLEEAKYSFAMANAHSNVLKAANYSTASNDEFGVECILEQLLSF